MLTLLGIAAGILVVFLITALTGYFVAQEFAYMAVDRSRLRARAEAGDAAAARALSVTRRTSFMLSGAQLGITITGLLVGYVAEPLIGSGVGELLGDVGIPVAAGVAIGTVIAILFSTVIQMVLGELFPKNLAIARPEPVARWLARSTTAYLAVFGWLIALFDKSSNLLLRLLRIEPVHDVEHSATPRDLEHIVAESRDAGELPADLSTLLDRILDFPTRTAGHAMIPRTRVDCVADDDTASSVLTRMSTGHTRYPVTDDDAEIVGVVHLHDLLVWSAAAATDPSATAADVCRRPVIVPTSLPLPEVIAQIEEAHDEMAVVIDEYGGFAGVVTVEDIAEELVGEIDDEHDPDAPEAIEHTGDGWLIRGDTHLDEVSREIGHDLPDDDHETIAGLVIGEFGGLPDVGDEVVFDLEPDPALLAHDEPIGPQSVRVVVLAVDRHVPSSVQLTMTPVPSEARSGRGRHVDATEEGGAR
ncbi:hemolysin family protein [Gordonia hankookensis]|uniref:HlyC/CorC family transporter n=1 Tax=Gordonia hankookensis TaxID=589403 RepID=A0ABR7WEQ6_9ACTN|nr:hemolysin family protein [Gordonia hankookensis]MBD1320219.1 HlyC/CorC family transporter [Gordonia hankookensis]